MRKNEREGEPERQMEVERKLTIGKYIDKDRGKQTKRWRGKNNEAKLIQVVRRKKREIKKNRGNRLIINSTDIFKCCCLTFTCTNIQK